MVNRLLLKGQHVPAFAPGILRAGTWGGRVDEAMVVLVGSTGESRWNWLFLVLGEK